MSAAPDFHARWLAAIDARRAGKVPDNALPGIDHPGFAVYANTGLAATVDALEANFPAVAGWLGPSSFRPLAIHHARLHPARDGRLFQYGRAFADFLRECGPMGDEAGLPELAHLDWLWMRAHVAADAVILDHGRWTAQDPATLASTAMRLAPATQWSCHDALPIWDWWSAARAGSTDRSLVHGPGQAVLFTRPGDAVLACGLDAAGCSFLQACAQGLSLADAAEAALQRAPEADLHALLSLLFAQGAFAEREPSAHPTGVTP